jgi:hypothetical protein
VRVVMISRLPSPVSKKEDSRTTLKSVLLIWHRAKSRITYDESVIRAKKKHPGLRISKGSISVAVNTFKRRNIGHDPRDFTWAYFCNSIFNDGNAESGSENESGGRGGGEVAWDVAEHDEGNKLPVDFLVDKCLGYLPGVKHKIVLYRYHAPCPRRCSELHSCLHERQPVRTVLQ